MITFKQYLSEETTPLPATNDVESFIIGQLQIIENTLKKYETRSRRVPSAPDTSKFIANQSGKVLPVKNSVMYRPYGLSAITLKYAVHIGSAIKYDKIAAAKNTMWMNIEDKFNVKVGVDYINIPAAPKDVQIWYGGGTNYYQIGLTIR